MMAADTSGHGLESIICTVWVQTSLCPPKDGHAVCLEPGHLLGVHSFMLLCPLGDVASGWIASTQVR